MKDLKHIQFNDINVRKEIQEKNRQIDDKINQRCQGLYFKREYEEFILSSPRGERILYVIYPSTRGGYAIKTVPVSSKDHSSRLPFPKEWSGLSDNELEEVSGIPGLTFCHSNLFIATCCKKNYKRKRGSVT